MDDPRQILAAQQNKARGEAVAAMKADLGGEAGIAWLDQEKAGICAAI
ncbi:DUF3516 domain-containing protein [Streptomyces cellulosae]